MDKEIKEYDNIITVSVVSFKGEYKDCGTHRLLLELNLDSDDMEELIEQIKLYE